MPDTVIKPWYQSLTMWGIAVMGIASLVLPLIGKPEAGTALQENQTDILAIIAKVGEVIGMVMAIIGRFTATSTLTK